MFQGLFSPWYLREIICAEVNFSWDKLNEDDKISKQYSSHKELCCYLNCNVLPQARDFCVNPDVR